MVATALCLNAKAELSSACRPRYLKHFHLDFYLQLASMFGLAHVVAFRS